MPDIPKLNMNNNSGIIIFSLLGFTIHLSKFWKKKKDYWWLIILIQATLLIILFTAVMLTAEDSAGISFQKADPIPKLKRYHIRTFAPL